MAQTINSSGEPVTAVFSWTVKPRRRELFEQRMHEIHRVARTFPGHMGVTTIKSPDRPDSYQTVLRFDTRAHMDAWLHSPTRQLLMRAIEEVAHPEATKSASGLETWFTIPGHAMVPPPKWKMAATTIIAIYPLSLLYAIYVAPNTLHWPVAARAMVVPILAPIILTYLFMPFLTQRVLKPWLYKK